MKQKETFEQKVKKAGSYKNYWTDQARLNLVGATIVKVEYMPQEEIDDMMWQRSPLCILLKRKNGTLKLGRPKKVKVEDSNEVVNK